MPVIYKRRYQTACNSSTTYMCNAVEKNNTRNAIHRGKRKRKKRECAQRCVPI